MRDAVRQCAEAHGFSCDEGYGWLENSQDRKLKGEMAAVIAGALPHRSHKSVWQHLDRYFFVGFDKKVCLWLHVSAVRLHHVAFEIFFYVGRLGVCASLSTFCPTPNSSLRFCSSS